MNEACCREIDDSALGKFPFIHNFLRVTDEIPSF